MTSPSNLLDRAALLVAASALFGLQACAKDPATQIVGTWSVDIEDMVVQAAEGGPMGDRLRARFEGAEITFELAEDGRFVANSQVDGDTSQEIGTWDIQVLDEDRRVNPDGSPNLVLHLPNGVEAGALSGVDSEHFRWESYGMTYRFSRVGDVE